MLRSEGGMVTVTVAVTVAVAVAEPCRGKSDKSDAPSSFSKIPKSNLTNHKAAQAHKRDMLAVHRGPWPGDLRQSPGDGFSVWDMKLLQGTPP